MQQPQQNLQEVLRQESLQRITDYVHPDIILKHQPINAKQCEDLKNQLRDLVKAKVEKVRRQYEAQDYNYKYNQVYGQFIQMTQTNQAQQQNMCNSIKYMHQLADNIMNPPSFSKDLYLSSKKAPSSLEAEQFQKIYEYYHKMYKSGQRKEESQAQQAIKRAKEYILRTHAS